MAEFRPVYMKCTQEQFERMRPKLERLGCEFYSFSDFKEYDYIVNNFRSTQNKVTNIKEHDIHTNERTQAQTEAEFLEACGYVEEESTQETLQEKEQRLIQELEEVRSKIKETEPKVGDIVKAYNVEYPNNFVIGRITEKNVYDPYLLGGFYFSNAEPLPKELQEQLKPYLK